MLLPVIAASFNFWFDGNYDCASRLYGNGGCDWSWRSWGSLYIRRIPASYNDVRMLAAYDINFGLLYLLSNLLEM